VVGSDTGEHSGEQLIKGRLLARNTLINFWGQIVPLGIAVFAMPVLIRKLGTDRFGVLTLIWMAIGYFSLIDFGLGRALTKLVAEKIGRREDREVASLVGTGMLLMGVLGTIAVPLVALLTPWLVGDVLNVPRMLRNEALNSFYVLAFCIPVVVCTVGTVGILEAHQRFSSINTVRVLSGAYMYLSPLLVLPFSRSLFPVVMVLAAGRLFTLVAYVIICSRALPSLFVGLKIQAQAIRPLVNFGGWITMTNVVDPFMRYLDRFFIGSMASMAAVAYYTTPYEVVTKLWIFPAALSGVFFPAFSTSYGQDPQRTVLLFGRALKSVFIMLFPIALLIVMLAHEGLDLWLGKEFAEHSTIVLQCLTVGVLVNGLARIPDGLVQALGRPDLTGKLHLAELPVYLMLLWWMIKAYGIEGAAVAWLIRASIDMVVLFLFSSRLLGDTSSVIKKISFFLVGALLSMILAFVPFGLAGKGVTVFLVSCSFGLCVWCLLLSPDERALARGWVRQEPIGWRLPRLKFRSDS